MYDKLLSLWIRLKHDDEGVTLVEYGVAVGVAVVLGGVAVSLLEPAFTTAMTNAGTAMTSP